MDIEEGGPALNTLLKDDRSHIEDVLSAEAACGTARGDEEMRAESDSVDVDKGPPATSRIEIELSSHPNVIYDEKERDEEHHEAIAEVEEIMEEVTEEAIVALDEIGVAPPSLEEDNGAGNHRSSHDNGESHSEEHQEAEDGDPREKGVEDMAPGIAEQREQESGTEVVTTEDDGSQGHDPDEIEAFIETERAGPVRAESGDQCIPFAGEMGQCLEADWEETVVEEKEEEEAEEEQRNGGEAMAEVREKLRRRWRWRNSSEDYNLEKRDFPNEESSNTTESPGDEEETPKEVQVVPKRSYDVWIEGNRGKTEGRFNFGLFSFLVLTTPLFFVLPGLTFLLFLFVQPL